MNRANVKILMLRKKINFTKIARHLGVSPQSIYEVLSGRMVSRRIEDALEAIFEMPIADIRAAWNTEGKAEMTVDIKAIAREVNEKYGIPAKAVGL